METVKLLDWLQAIVVPGLTPEVESADRGLMVGLLMVNGSELFEVAPPKPGLPLLSWTVTS